jgi:PAS domain S-box-containing protein
MGERFDLLATDAKEYAVFLVGLDGDLLCWNTGAERIFGYQSHEIIGQHFSRFFPPDDIVTGRPEHELKTALTDGRAVCNCWQTRKDGTRFWCQSVVTPLLNENKQVRSFAIVTHDLTESEATQAQRKRADGLAEANRSKEEFMALLSHELRSPLVIDRPDHTRIKKFLVAVFTMARIDRSRWARTNSADPSSPSSSMSKNTILVCVRNRIFAKPSASRARIAVEAALSTAPLLSVPSGRRAAS